MLKKLMSVLLLLFVFIAGCSAVSVEENTSLYEVVRVVDGDTIVIDFNGKEEKVRFIGVNTPEIHHPKKDVEYYGHEAAHFTKELIEGKKVRIEFDVEKRDRYGRLLAYVYLKDGTFVNALLVEEGYAQVMTVPPNVKYADKFVELQKKARDAKKGLWGIEKK